MNLILPIESYVAGGKLEYAFPNSDFLVADGEGLKVHRQETRELTSRDSPLSVYVEAPDWANAIMTERDGKRISFLQVDFHLVDKLEVPIRNFWRDFHSDNPLNTFERPISTDYNGCAIGEGDF